MKIKIGTITLKKRHEFTQYSESAAWTDYVTCEPQTVELFRDDYWAFAKFNGILTRTTFPLRTIGDEHPAGIQTQKWGGIADWMDSDLFSVTLLPEYRLKEVGRYSEGCGARSGFPILALEPTNP